MLLQKTGLRIKQFISHRRNSSLEEYNEGLKDNFVENHSPAKYQPDSSKRISWMSPSLAPEVLHLRRASSSATTRSHLSPPINSTAHSSASSLCSCECATNSFSSSSLSTTPPRMEPRPEILYLPAVSSASSSDAKTWRLIFPKSSPCSTREVTCSSGTASVRESTFNLLEALTIDLVDSDVTPTQSIRNTEDSDMESVEENVEQLIRETDEAFQAVGMALADAKVATQRWHDASAQEPITQNVLVARKPLKKDTQPFAATTNSPVIKTKSVVKGKRKALHRKKNLLSRIRNVPPPPANTPTRWTLTDVTANMIDIFNERMFKTEVDEMLTPDRLRRLKQEEKAENERRISAESTRSAETDEGTPTEPFHLESLSSRLASVQTKESLSPPFPSPVLPPPVTPQRRSPVGRGVRAGKAKAIEARKNDLGMEFQDLNFPSPPRIPARSNARRLPSTLSTIPEVSPLNFIASQTFDRDKHRQFSFESIQPPPGYFLLPSTSFTLTSPFRQGPIRIERKATDMLPDNEPLDWTAFQMAILGTMDEIGVDERDDIEWEADEAEIDDILEWWEGYKFSGYGEIIHGEPPSRPKGADVMAIKTHRGILRNDSGMDKIVVERSLQAGPIRWMKKEYAESLPPSPLQDLVPPNPIRDEVIPMGFNLGHDLGDFLDWETQYVRKYFVDN